MSRPIEALVCLILILVGATGYIASSHITGLTLDPIGPRGVPRTVSVLLVLLTLIVIVRVFLGRAQPTIDQTEAVSLHKLGLVLGLVTFTVIYCYTLFFLRFPFSLTTMLFIIISAQFLIKERRLKWTIYAALSGAIAGFVIEYLFTQVFFVDLPTIW